jgi:hypothetical protein
VVSSELSKGDEWAAIKAAVLKANRKDATKADLAELRKALDAHPDAWRILGDLAQLAMDSVVDYFYKPMGEDAEAHRESARRATGAIKRDLGYKTASPLEKLLIEQVAVCWLRAYIAEIYVTIARAGDSLEYWNRQLSAAQRRYLRAIETLARVRRLGVPAVQVNIGAQQVNQVNLPGAAE